MRATFSLLLIVSLAAASLAAAQALELPKVPTSGRILSADEVKNYWVNKMPEPQEPSRLARNYKTDHLLYLEKVGQRHRLIREIRGGQHDQLAKIVALRHNIQAHLLNGQPVKAAALRAELEELEGVARQAELLELERANAERLERLIAATERLAAAIENNAGDMPPEAAADEAEAAAEEIIPFERDRDRRRQHIAPHDLVIDLHDEIIAFRNRPIIVHRGNPTHIRPAVDGGSGVRTHIHPNDGHVIQSPGVRQPQVRQPQVRQPQVRQPAVQQPGVRVPQRKISPPAQRQPQSRQQPTRQPQPSVRPAPAPQPRQPQVRQPQIRPAR